MGSSTSQGLPDPGNSIITDSAARAGPETGPGMYVPMSPPNLYAR